MSKKKYTETPDDAPTVVVFRCSQKGCVFENENNSAPDTCPVCGNPFVANTETEPS
jgi:rubrerythrin